MLRSLFADLLGSFHSAPLYLRRLRDDRGTGFAWLAFACLLASLPTVVKTHYGVVTEGPAKSAALIEQMPLLVFDTGKLTAIPGGRKAVVEDGKEVLIVDAEFEGLTDEVGQGQIVMTQDYFVSRNANGQIRAQPYDWIGSRSVTHEDLQRWWTWWMHWGWVVLLPFMFGVYFVGMALFTLLMSAVALGLARIARVDAGYSALLRVTALAATPAIMLDGFSDVIGQAVPSAIWIRIGLTVAFLWFAMRAARHESGADVGPLA